MVGIVPCIRRSAPGRRGSREWLAARPRRGDPGRHRARGGGRGYRHLDAQAADTAKALNLIDKLIDDPEEAVSFQVRENQVIFHTSSATLTSNLVEGQFPPFEDVIPKDTDKKMTASTADFLSAIRRAALLTTEESKGVRMHFSKKGLVLIYLVQHTGGYPGKDGPRIFPTFVKAATAAGQMNGSSGGRIPRWRKACEVNSRPRGVRWRKPRWSRYGS